MAEIWFANALKTLFSLMLCVMLATLVYALCIDGLPFRKELFTPWMAATLVDFYINIFALGAWIIYRESSSLTSVIWIALLVCLGSVTTCAYIILQLFKLSSEEALVDPIYYVLWRHENKEGLGQKGKCFPVVTARIVFSALGCLMLGTLIYTLVTDGSPFRTELLTTWMSATLIDFYINVVALSVWVAYKESTWISAFLWIVLLISFGSITTCVYIAQQLFQLSSQDPTYLVLLKSSNSVTTCAYIILQLFKLSSEKALVDPIYYVLWRHEDKYAKQFNGDDVVP